MASKDLIERIRSLDKLTPSESKIADFFSQRFPETVFENVTTISQKTGVSKATVVRFISRLGYKGFSSFRDQQRQEVVSRLETPIQRYSLKKKQLMEKGEDILGRNISYIMKNLRHTHARTDQETFMKAARMIADPKGNLFIMAQRTSYGLGYLLHVLLGYLRPNTILLDPQASLLPDRLVDVTDKDTLFAITHRRYARLTLQVATAFSNAGAKVLLLTDSEFSPLSPLADLQLVVPSDGLSIFQSFCSAAAVLESLVIAALQFCDDGMYERSERAERLYADFSTFCVGKASPETRAERLKAGVKKVRHPRKRDQNPAP